MNEELGNKLDSTCVKGKRAEQNARHLLEQKGYVYVESNFRWRGGEIDLVMLSPQSALPGTQELVFVEVRSALKTSVWLRSSISMPKRRRLISTAHQYIHCRKKGRASEIRGFRFDIVWIEGKVYEHWENVLL